MRGPKEGGQRGLEASLLCLGEGRPGGARVWDLTDHGRGGEQVYTGPWGGGLQGLGLCAK